MNFASDPSAATPIATLIFRANSIFDPEYAVGGHQPLGHDQWAYFYDHYSVISSTIKISIGGVVPSSTIMEPAVAGVYLDDDTTSVTSWQNIAEQGRCRYRLVNVDPRAPNGRVTLYSSYSARKFFHVKDVNGDRELGAAFGSNPVEDAYFLFFLSSLDGLTDITYMEGFAEITYTCRLSEPKTIPES